MNIEWKRKRIQQEIARGKRRKKAKQQQQKEEKEEEEEENDEKTEQIENDMKHRTYIHEAPIISCK